MRPSLLLGVAAVVLLVVRSASAQENANADAQAEKLFEEGRVLMEQRRYPEACAKLAASARLSPSGGTLLNLADCYEKDGKTASAWARFKEVATRAANAKRPDIEAHARSRAAALEPKLSTLTVTVPPEVAKIDGLVIRRGDVEVERAAWGSALPIDPGDYNVEASAPSKKKWQSKVSVGSVADRVVIAVPMLESDGVVTTSERRTKDTLPPPSPSPPSSPPSSSAGGWSTQRWIGLGVAAGGVVALGFGAVFGLKASSDNDEALKYCPQSPACNDPRGPQLTSDAQDAATISTIAFVGGGVLVAAGAVLWLTAPSSSKPSPTATGLMLTPRGAALAGHFW